jgi:hypothetical protein
MRREMVKIEWEVLRPRPESKYLVLPGYLALTRTPAISNYEGD